jgi:hypothetical protein
MPQPLAPAIIDAIVEQVAQGRTFGQTGEALGLSRSQVAGVVHRQRQRGDPRLPVAGEGPIVSNAQLRRQHKAALAEAMADGAPTLTVAAYAARLALPRARDLWTEIRSELGRQAA